MIMRISMPNRFRLKKVMGFRTMIRPERGEIHYIGVRAKIFPDIQKFIEKRKEEYLNEQDKKLSTYKKGNHGKGNPRPSRQ